MCNDFSGQCCTHKSSDGPLEASGASGGPIGPRPGPSTSTGSLGYTPNCSSCNKLTSEGAYKCSVCPSCILCEMCRHSHDPSHNLVRTKTPLSIPEHGMSGELRFPRRGDRTVRKAERQRLKAERRQLRAEVKEIKKKLRLEKRGLQWSGPSTSGRKPGLFSTMLCTLETRSPGVSHTSLVPTMAALFLDENLPDGTRLEPGTKFIKYWKMRNSGTISWTSETKLVFMWGNLGLASEEKREMPVPLLLPGQVGVVSVAFVAPVMEGMYTSHWRLAHCGCQFGPRVWCSIVVDPGDGRNTLGHQSKRLASLISNDTLYCCSENISLEKEEVRARDSDPGLFVDLNHEDYYFPSVDLLTAQDLLSFELLDINIVQELEKVPNNTPVDLTPCISPLPHDAPVLEKAIFSQMKEDAEVTGVRKLFGKTSCYKVETIKSEDREEEISGAQFLCETVIRSLALEEAPDHRPLRRAQHGSHKPQGEEPLCLPQSHSLLVRANMRDSQDEKEEGGTKGEDWEEVSSQTSSVSSCDDYIIVLPDCFDTSRPLGESMYSSAMSQPDIVDAEDSSVNTWPLAVPPTHSSVNQMLCASQTLDAVTLTPEVVPPPVLPDSLLPPPTLYSPRSDQSNGPCAVQKPAACIKRNCITEGLVKGALSVAASAYKALFTGPNCSIQVHHTETLQDPSLMAMLLEMGFRDQRLNQRLLRKHGYSLLHTVNELVQIAEDGQKKAVNTKH
uniref:NBR1 autophagy cargo receptor a n=1 Tax=Sander lucioperca TaxID=283035 RepID=A0A8C9YI82_SANLU